MQESSRNSAGSCPNQIFEWEARRSSEHLAFPIAKSCRKSFRRSIRTPHPRSAFEVIEDVAENVELMGAVVDGFGVTAFGEEAAFFGAETLLSHGMRRMFFGSADPMSGVVVGEASEDVNVLGIDG